MLLKPDPSFGRGSIWTITAPELKTAKQFNNVEIRGRAIYEVPKAQKEFK